MKKFVLIAGLLAWSGVSQAETNQTQIVNSRPTLKRPSDSFLAGSSTAPHRIVKKRVAYSGIVAQAARTSRPWQLINPFAPIDPALGTAQVSRDPATGRAQGVALFSVDF